MNTKADRNKNSSYKSNAVSTWDVIKIALVSIVILVFIVFLTYEFFLKSKERAVYENLFQPESEKLVSVRKQADRKLHSYAVIDSEKNVYRIPIEKAIDLIVNEAREKN
ncbi:MAG: hypothetical protein GXO92_01005 [FCB group bacterium]|nr:hypothetical protein [FCB group bacterium]